MSKILRINEITDIPAINIALDTINQNKQALVFCNTKMTAESTAEKISRLIKVSDTELNLLSEKILKVLSSPTKQCKRLALMIRKGIAFHHSGLPSGQRKMVEDGFRKGTIKIICSTPTLAFGLNLPAFRAIMKDLKRYGGRWGMQWIPTLEYHQCIGRAGRPDFNDKFGEAISVATTGSEKSELLKRFVNGAPEPIYSKLAVEPVLRTYVLSLVATGFVNTKKELFEFFYRSFYAHQYKDLKEIEYIISKIIDNLEEWEFIKTTGINKSSDFISADEIEEVKIEASRLGQRISQLYIDPLTANFLINGMRRATGRICNEFSFLHLAANTLELRPYFRVRTKEIEEVQDVLNEYSVNIIVLEPSVYEPEYDDFLNSTKTALVLNEWLEEKDEEYLLEKYNVRPGEFNYKKDSCDWILFSSEEIAKLMQFKDIVRIIRKARFRLKNGVKEELIPLVKIKGIGRIRARKLFRNGIKDIGDIKNADITQLVQLLGKNIAIKLKKEVGIDIDKDKVPEGRRKGQTGLLKY
ncbi:MAG: hypothetical protein KKF44_07785 [Nanoarchaeota archaeon]|nr:hypothetical protein [Nanoarchaeota archaeon]